MLARDAFDRANIPTKLRELCSYNDVLDQISVELEEPGQISESDLEILAKLGVTQLKVRPKSDRFDIRTLSKSLPYFPQLLFFAPKSGTYVGAAALRTANNCERLYVEGSMDTEPDLRALPRLASFVSTSIFWPSVAANPNLQKLWLATPALGDDFVIAGQLQELALIGAREVASMPVLRHPEGLTRLDIRGSKRFDVSSLEKFVSLKLVEFTQCQSLENVEALLTLPAINVLRFFNVRSIPNYEALASLKVKSLYVEGNYVFDNEFRALGKSRGWTIPAMRRGRLKVVP